MAIPLAGGSPAQVCHEVRAVDAIHLAVSLQPSYPGHRHAVRSVHKCSVQNAAKMCIGLCFHHSVNASHADVGTLSGRNPTFRQIDRAIHIDGGERDAENVSMWMSK